MTARDLTPEQMAEYRRLVEQGVSEELALFMARNNVSSTAPAPGPTQTPTSPVMPAPTTMTPQPTTVAEGTSSSLDQLLANFGTSGDADKYQPLEPLGMDRSYRQDVFNRHMQPDPIHGEPNATTRGLMNDRFNQMDALYTATHQDYPGYQSFLRANENPPGPRGLAELVRNTDFASALPRPQQHDPSPVATPFGGVVSGEVDLADALAQIVAPTQQEPQGMTADQAMIEQGAYNLIAEAVAANLNPLAASHARRNMARRYADHREIGGTNAGFALREMPRWETILGVS